MPVVDTGPTVDAALREVARQHGDQLAFVDGDLRATYADWERAAAGAARALAAAGVQRGDVVAIRLPSSFDFAVAYMAASWLGAVATGINARLAPVEVQRVFDRAQPRAVVGDAGDPRSGETAAVVSTSELRGAAAGPRAAAAEGRSSDEAAVIAWTSGTTGAPKGAWFSHRALQAASWQSGALSGPFERRLLATPFAHVGFLARVWDQLAWVMASVLTPPTWSAAAMLGLLVDERITIGQGVPTQWEKVLELDDLDAAELSHLRVVGTGATRVPPELVHELRRRLGCAVVVRYACTEVPIATGTGEHDAVETVSSTIGRPAPGVEARLVDERGLEVGDGAVGRILLRSPGAMSGYWRDDERTADAIGPGGWIKTGDLGQWTTSGELTIVGRLSEVYIRGGYNVYPLEVERVLLAHEAVTQVAVVGTGAPTIGEVGVAFVVLDRAAPAPSPPELQAWCRRHLADYKTPDAVVFVDALPVNAMMKVDKRALASDAAAAADRAAAARRR